MENGYARLGVGSVQLRIFSDRERTPPITNEKIGPETHPVPGNRTVETSRLLERICDFVPASAQYTAKSSEPALELIEDRKIRLKCYVVERSQSRQPGCKVRGNGGVSVYYHARIPISKVDLPDRPSYRVRLSRCPRVSSDHGFHAILVRYRRGVIGTIIGNHNDPPAGPGVCHSCQGMDTGSDHQLFIVSGNQKQQARRLLARSSARRMDWLAPQQAKQL